MDKLSEGPNTPEPLTNREAGGLLLAFIAAVVLVLGVATSLPAPTAGTANQGPSGQVSGSVER